MLFLFCFLIKKSAKIYYYCYKSCNIKVYKILYIWCVIGNNIALKEKDIKDGEGKNEKNPRENGSDIHITQPPLHGELTRQITESIRHRALSLENGEKDAMNAVKELGKMGDGIGGLLSVGMTTENYAVGSAVIGALQEMNEDSLSFVMIANTTKKEEIAKYAIDALKERKDIDSLSEIKVMEDPKNESVKEYAENAIKEIKEGNRQ